MRTLVAIVLVLSAALAGAQSPPPATTPPSTAPAAAPPEKTLDKTASPELVGQLVSDLGVTPAQAEGAAGTLFGLAKTKLTPEEFGKVATAVPNMDGLLKAAPAPAADSKATGVDALLGKAAASAGGGVAAASTLSKLGIRTETIAKVAPSLIKAVQSKGGAEVAGLLAGALK